MQLFPDAPTKSGTMVMHPERAEPVKRPTQQLPQKTGTLELHPERPAPSRKRTTQLFSEAAVKPMKGRTTQLFQGVDEVPAPRTTAPLFPVEEPDAARPPPPVPDAPVIDAAVPLPADTGEAWGWSAADYAAPMEPRPSPALSPSAESAWDQRTNPGIKLEVQGDDRPLDLLTSDSKITRAPPDAREELNVILRGARDLLDLDDHTGAMELVNKARELAPDDPEVVAIAERSEKTLLTMYESKLGRLESVPRVLLKDDEIIWLNLDHRAGFVLAQIDGTVCFDDLFSVSGMSRIDTARIIAQLIDEGVISRE